MAVIRIGGFRGAIPRIHPRLLPEGAAQEAINCRLETGAVESVNDTNTIQATDLTDPISLYRYSASVWLESTTDTDWVPYPVTNDVFGRIIFSDPSASELRVTDGSLVGAAGYPDNYYRLDVPAPMQGFSAVLNGTATDAESQPESRFYVVTFVNSYGAEGPPSPPSNEVEWRLGQTVSLSGLPSVPTGNYNITHRRIYRINTGSTGVSNYQFVSEVAVSSPTLTVTAATAANPVVVTTSTAHNFLDGMEVTFASVGGMTELNGNSYFVDVISPTTFSLAGIDGTAFTTYTSGGTVRQLAGTTYSDSVPSESLAEVLSTTTYDPPNAATKGLKTHPSGFLVGFFDKTICFSEIGAPHAWPLEYRLPTAYDIVGLGIFGNTVVVTTTGLPYLVVGSDPSAMTIIELEVEQSCVSKRGIVDFGSVVVYPSPDGLVAVSNNGPENVTSGIFTRAQWQALVPSSIVGFNWENYYLGFYDNGAGITRAFVINPFAQDFGVRYMTPYVTAGVKDLQEDLLYLVRGANIVTWDESTTKLEYSWKSKPVYTPRAVNMSVGRIIADTYPVSMDLYVDDVLRTQRLVRSATAFRLPGGYRGEKFEVVIKGVTTVSEIALSTTMQEMAAIV